MCSELGFGAKRLRLSDDDRRRLAVKAQALGREALAQIASVATPCAPQKVDPALIARFRHAMVGCFWPVFFFADHRSCTPRRSNT